MRAMRGLGTLLAFLAVLSCAGCGSTAAPARHPAEGAIARFSGPVLSPQVTAVQFLARAHGWLGRAEPGADGGVVAGSTRLLATSDGGRTWRRGATAPGPILAIDFSTPRDGLVLVGRGKGLELLASSDAGRTLREISRPAGSGAAVEMRFTSPDAGFLVAGGYLDVTADGGRTWRSSALRLPSLVQNGEAGAPYFLSPTLGFLAQNGALYRTSDGGGTWTAVYRLPAALASWGGGVAFGPTTFAGPQQGYAVLNIPNCWAGGCPDVVVASRDGGASWKPVSYEMQGQLPGLSVPGGGPPGGVTALVAWGAAGVAATTMRGVAVSADGGAAWVVPGGASGAMPATFTLLAPRPGGGALAAGNSLLLAVPGIGELRELWPLGLPAVIDFVTQREGFGIERQPWQGLLRTTDSGQVWRQERPWATELGANGLSFASARDGWLVDVYGGLHATADGGSTWRTRALEPVASACLLPRGLGFALTTPGGTPELFAVAQGGASFARRGLPQGPGNVGQLACASARFLYLAGQDGVYGTRDGGRTWQPLAMPRGLGDIVQVTAATDRQGDLWLLLLLRGPTMTEDLAVREAGGTWRVVRLPGAVAGQSYAQSLSALTGRDAYLAMPSGVFRTADGGLDWRNVARYPGD